MSHFEKKNKAFSTKYRMRRNVIFDEVVFDELSCTDLDISDSFMDNKRWVDNKRRYNAAQWIPAGACHHKSLRLWRIDHTSL